MVDIAVREAAKRLEVSDQRVRDMLRSGELTGRQLAGHWIVDLGSVQERARLGFPHGRPWSERTVEHVVTALSYGTGADAKTQRRIMTTETGELWRKIAQTIEIRRFATRNIGLVRNQVSLTGESAIKVLGERLVGESSTLHGYLTGCTLEDLIDDAGLVDDLNGNVAIYTPSSGSSTWVSTGIAQRALVGVDCARATPTRVHSAGVRALDQMRAEWLTRNT